MARLAAPPLPSAPLPPSPCIRHQRRGGMGAAATTGPAAPPLPSFPGGDGSARAADLASTTVGGGRSVAGDRGDNGSIAGNRGMTAAGLG
ncbi:hypothetical protein [Oryza sativa Japonica Group]|uniref:Uncharacterized protein n=1 Tax=Oryza sativa subsp. japonica TaxID=39947 RepID=Q5N964_ORYSJ|nr:hypothetical protein [Oryza sativa Japonica Group]